MRPSEWAAALADPAIDAVIGSYDDDPSSRDFLSQYKNLMHCFVHQNACSEASTVLERLRAPSVATSFWR